MLAAWRFLFDPVQLYAMIFMDGGEWEGVGEKRRLAVFCFGKGDSAKTFCALPGGPPQPGSPMADAADVIAGEWRLPLHSVVSFALLPSLATEDIIAMSSIHQAAIFHCSTATTDATDGLGFPSPICGMWHGRGTTV